MLFLTVTSPRIRITESVAILWALPAAWYKIIFARIYP